jgi:hypothetical protein
LTLGATVRKILAGAAALLGTAVTAHAADLAVKAPYLKAPAEMVYDWTGFYISVLSKPARRPGRRPGRL